jgi:hypothetical protein
MYSGQGTSLSNRAVDSKLRVNSRLAARDVLKLLGPIQKVRKRRVEKSAITAFEKGDITKLRRRKLSPEDFEQLQRQNVENGRLGEEFVLHRNGTEKWIEVKATVNAGRSFPMSDNEWKTACRAKEKYWIYRVIHVRAKPKIQGKLCDPKQLESLGRLERTAMGWRITFN